MTQPQRAIMIVDQGSIGAVELREALQRSTFKVHVVNSVAAALLVLRIKQLDGAIIDRNCLAKCRTLCDELVKNGVPFIFQGARDENVST